MILGDQLIRGALEESTERIDDRVGLRIHTIYMVAKVVRERDVGLWRVENISNGGLKFRVTQKVQIGERSRYFCPTPSSLMVRWSGAATTAAGSNSTTRSTVRRCSDILPRSEPMTATAPSDFLSTVEAWSTPITVFMP